MSPGVVRFEHGGGEHTLAASNGKTGGLDILFTDETSGVTTYAANRSLSADVAPDGTVTLDFNRATNLPCAFTDFATCPLPPAGNHLPFAIAAGERTPYERVHRGHQLTQRRRSATALSHCWAGSLASWPHVMLSVATQRFGEALDRLLRNAKHAGAIASDVQTDDLAAFAVGGAALRSAHRNRARGTRLIRLLLDGLRTLAVTEADAFRDIPSLRRHETAAHCVECGARLHIRAAGRTTPPATAARPAVSAPAAAVLPADHRYGRLRVAV